MMKWRQAAEKACTVVQATLFLGAIAGLYWGLLWMFDLTDHRDIGWGHLTGGVGVLLLFMIIVGIMGESRIENVVKTVLCAPLLILPTYHAVFGVYAIGAFLGVAAPVVWMLTPDPKTVLRFCLKNFFS